jgi:hypothetical protein
MKNKNLKVTLATSVALLSFVTLLIGGCQVETNHDEIDPVITNSPELEDFIIAATDLDQAMNIFKREIENMDFTKLETVIKDGREVTYLPEPIPSLHIEQKSLLMQEKRVALFNRFPQFASMDVDDARRHIDKCIKQSERVTDDFLKKGINIYQPLTRQTPHESFATSYDNKSKLISDLSNWLGQPNYSEVYILMYQDGTYRVYPGGGNGYSANIVLKGNTQTGVYYYPTASPSNKIIGIAHTHQHSANASNDDIANKRNGLPAYIYFGGAFHRY